VLFIIIFFFLFFFFFLSFFFVLGPFLIIYCLIVWENWVHSTRPKKRSGVPGCVTSYVRDDNDACVVFCDRRMFLQKHGNGK
jgi:hypothetical protein